MSSMRRDALTVARAGSDYRASLRDGRRVFVMGEGLMDDVTTHPATQPMVDEYVAWYDRHFDPTWQDVVLLPPDLCGCQVSLEGPVAHSHLTLI